MTVKGTYASNQTDAAKAGLNLTVDPIEKFVLRGFQRHFLSYFECPAIWLTTDAEDVALNKLFNRSQGNDAKSVVPYPYAFLRLQTVAEDTNRFSVNRMALRGLTIVPTQDTKRAFRVHVLPAEFSVSVKYVTNKHQDAVTFANRWLFAKRRSHLKFNVNYGRGSFTVSCEPDGSISIPQPPATHEEIVEYVLEPTVIIKGFLSDPVLQEQQVAEELNVSLMVTPQDGNTERAVWAFPLPNT